ncbi:MAG TPA: Fe-S metabolism protein SufE [Bacteroidales bacterium]|nr:MAG: Fe-S metabolism protein SufE [Bacteroidetes bacterium GWF2_33_38]OFY71634.1 MAG: Fe-S metabolism protein SufE [Bacteroidetes bacterium RIFOXYA12_FULL_33_9]OFY89705.1 MAG: Fe-S metabolism protein SufE [Bacteroidetes bacterium RIFOXYA2_FULL_33_7]HBF88072.1 Fe-S metabolism protein SufE [Bacteroidales bacterium]
MKKSIEDIQKEIIEDFIIFDDWLDKYEHIIEIARDLPMISEDFKTDEYLIKGCQSKVWLHAELKEGKIYFSADSDAIITKGIVYLLVKVMNERTPKEILDAEMFFIDKIGLKENLSPTRSNGLVSMLKQMKLYALAYDAKMKK